MPHDSEATTPERKTPVLHPWIFAVVPVLHLMSGNALWIGLADCAWPILFSLLFAALVFGVTRVFIRDNHKAALFTSIVVVLFFAYSSLFRLINGNLAWFDRQRYLLVLYVLLVPLVFFLIARMKRKPVAVTAILNVMAGALLLLNAYFVLAVQFKQSKPDFEPNALVEAVRLPQQPPDVYVFLLDGYARADVMQSMHGFDNRTFLNTLRSRGFYVDDSSRSNYAHTIATLASMLNMDFLRKSPGNWHGALRLRDAIRKNKTFATLERLGYDVYTFPTGSAFADISTANHYTSFPYIDEVSLNLMHTTPLVSMPLMNAMFVPMKRKLVTFPYEQLNEIVPNAAKPKIVFIHSVCPHPPYLFGARGEVIPQKDNVWFDIAWSKITGEQYTNQVQFINQRVLAALDVIDRSTNPSTVIIMSDHGSKTLEDYEPHYFGEAYANLSAVRFPGLNQNDYAASLTPVNYFRILFNGYFDTRLPLLPNDSFHFAQQQNPPLEKVNDKVTEEEKRHRAALVQLQN